MKIMVQTALAATMVVAGMIVPAMAQSDDGGPDQLEVYDLTTKKHLNVRSGPSRKSPVIAGLVMGDVVKNLGCATSDAGRWCSIETKDGTKGYSFGAFLKEAAGMAAATPEAAPAMAPAVAAYATGKLPCERYNADPTKECDFGIVRYGPGKARLIVIWPDATRRMFGVFGNIVTSGDGKVDASAAADGAITMTLNAVGMATERYVVPAGLVDGK